MKRVLLILLGGLLLIAVALFANRLMQRAEPYDEVIKLGPSPEARANPYLAAEYFLRKQGIKVDQYHRLGAVYSRPSRGKTLLLLSSRDAMSPKQNEQLLQWTAKGGHLVVIAERLWNEEQGSSGDALLDGLGVQQYATERPRHAEENTQSKHGDMASKEHQDNYPQLTKLYLENEAAPAYIDFDQRYELYDANNQAHVWANSAEATHLLQLYYGEGLITVLSDAWIWESDQLADYDNAWLLWYLTQDSEVALVYNPDKDNLLTLLLRHFGPALLALALLLGLALWHFSLREGPLLQAQEKSRRQLLEHLRGSAEFLLHQRGQKQLLQNLQTDVLRRARRRHPGFERLAVAEQWRILARLSRLPSSAISQAMRPLPNKNFSANDFTRQVTHLQTLRNVL